MLRGNITSTTTNKKRKMTDMNGATHSVMDRAIQRSSSYSPHAMMNLLLLLKHQLHDLLNDKAVFTLLLCSKSLAPLVTGYAVSQEVAISFERDEPRVDQLGQLAMRMGMIAEAVRLEGNELPMPVCNSVGILPEALHTVILGKAFNQRLAVGAFPASLKHLELGDAFNQPLAAGVLPASLHSLTLGNSFNQPLAAGLLPASLHKLVLGSHFNQPLAAGDLPASLHTLDFGYNADFNQPLAAGVLPASLHSLDFDLYGQFNQPLTAQVLPTSLHSLTFGAYFNQPIAAGTLPDSLELLRFGFLFDQPIASGVLPRGLTQLEVCESYSHDLSEALKCCASCEVFRFEMDVLLENEDEDAFDEDGSDHGE